MPSTDDEARPPRVDDIDDLYRVRPEEFVAARDALARRLREEGRKDEAAGVKKRRRPTVVAWAVNQLPVIAGAELDRLLDESNLLREAQQEALTGNAKDLRRATDERRRTIDALADRAATRLVESGVSDARHEHEISVTLDAASLDIHAADNLRAGRLERELERSGFVFPSDWSPPADEDGTRAEEEAQREREERRARAERDVRRARDRLDAAQEEVDRLSRRLTRAEKERDDAEEAVREAEDRLRELEDEKA